MFNYIMYNELLTISSIMFYNIYFNSTLTHYTAKFKKTLRLLLRNLFNNECAKKYIYIL